MKTQLLLSIVFCAITSFAQGSDPNEIVGIWKSPSQNLMIKIDKIGNQFQGRIVWLNAEEQKQYDINNPDKQLTKMPLKGTKVIHELSFNPTLTSWEGGKFYHHEEGKVYNCQIILQSNMEIQIIRYIQNQQDKIIETWVRQ